jgi:hypothetical protein
MDEIFRTSWRFEVMAAVCACLLLSAAYLLIFV